MYRAMRAPSLLLVLHLLTLALAPASLLFASARAVPALAQVQAQDDSAALAAGLLALNDFAAASQAALAQGDVAGARAAYQAFDAGWEDLEDGVRARSRDAYRVIEDAMREVARALRTEPVNVATATALLAELQEQVQQFVATLEAH